MIRNTRIHTNARAQEFIHAHTDNHAHIPAPTPCIKLILKKSFIPVVSFYVIEYCLKPYFMLDRKVKRAKDSTSTSSFNTGHVYTCIFFKVYKPRWCMT